MNLLQLIVSKLTQPITRPISPKHLHHLVHRADMDEHPIHNPDNWLPKKKVDILISRPHLWRKA